jgi:Xaa-Pro aminopeptidase
MTTGTMAVDFEERINYERLRRERLARTREQMKAYGLGALLCYDFDNIRYITGTLSFTTRPPRPSARLHPGSPTAFSRPWAP